MDFIEFTAGQNDDGRRLDKVFRIIAADLPLSNLYKYIRKGLVRVNGKKIRPDFRLSSGDVIQLAAFIADGKKTEKENIKENKDDEKSLSVIFENENYLVVKKPYDISVHGAIQNGKKPLEDIVRKYLKSTQESSLAFTPGPLHRLDRKTSGLIVFSKSLLGARWFSELIKNHGIIKSYCAVLQGKLKEKCTWKDYIYSQEEKGAGFHKVRCSSDVNPDSDSDSDKWKEALSLAEPLAFGTFKGITVTLARITIYTGRKHQIRAQSAFHSFPLLGDTAYGAESLKDSGLSRDFYLAAERLTLLEEYYDNESGFPKELFVD